MTDEEMTKGMRKVDEAPQMTKRWWKRAQRVGHFRPEKAGLVGWQRRETSARNVLIKKGLKEQKMQLLLPDRSATVRTHVERIFSQSFPRPHFPRLQHRDTHVFHLVKQLKMLADESAWKASCECNRVQM